MPPVITPTSPTIDTTTQGTWLGRYGTQGYCAPEIGTTLYDFTAIIPSGDLLYTWSASTTDPRALQLAAGTGRTAACWYSGISFSVVVNLSDGKQYLLSLYCVDWDSQSRSQQVEILDPKGNLLGSETLSGFSGGTWLQWPISGSVTIKVTKLAGPNAVLSGIFLDAAPGLYWVVNPAGKPLLGTDDLHCLRASISTLAPGPYTLLFGATPCGTVVVTSETQWTLTGPGGYQEGLDL
jgi:hypothetical protein